MRAVHRQEVMAVALVFVGVVPPVPVVVVDGVHASVRDAAHNPLEISRISPP